MELTSSAFSPGALIPKKYTCDGEQVPPPLHIDGVPEGTRSLVLVMDDPDIPHAVKEERGIEVFDHWVLFNIPPETTEIPEGEEIGSPGLNGTGKPGYIGPCPPPQFEPKEHRYIFTLYALRDILSFSDIPVKRQVLDALDPFLMGQAQLIGRYSRN